MRGVSNDANFHRFNQQYLKSARDYNDQLPEVQEGEEYSRNVEIISKMLLLHDEYNESMMRKMSIVAKGEKITIQAMNPIMHEKVADVMR